MKSKEEVLAEARERHGEEWVEERRELVLSQARMVGELPYEDEPIDGEAHDDDAERAMESVHGSGEFRDPFKAVPATDFTDAEGAFHSMYTEVLWDEQAAGKELYAGTRMPDEVRERLVEALEEGALFEDFETITADEREDLFTFLVNQAKGDGWTVRSLASRLKNIDPSLTQYEAERIARTETQAIVTEARERYYRQEFDAEDALFIWQGPQDHRTTEACTWLKEQANPRYGGEARDIETMKELVEEASRRFFPDLDLRSWTIHPHERHTIVRYYDLSAA